MERRGAQAGLPEEVLPNLSAARLLFTFLKNCWAETLLFLHTRLLPDVVVLETGAFSILPRENRKQTGKATHEDKRVAAEVAWSVTQDLSARRDPVRRPNPLRQNETGVFNWCCRLCGGSCFRPAPLSIQNGNLPGSSW
jgi:hypothetical protein